MVFMKWVVIVIVVLVVIVLTIKFLTRNNNRDGGGGLEGRMGIVGKLWDRCCARVKGRRGI